MSKTLFNTFFVLVLLDRRWLRVKRESISAVWLVAVTLNTKQIIGV